MLNGKEGRTGLSIVDVLPWLTACAIVVGAVFGVAEMRRSTAEVAVEIRHLSRAVTTLSGQLESQREKLNTVSVAVAALPRTEEELRALRRKVERLESRIPQLMRSPGDAGDE